MERKAGNRQWHDLPTLAFLVIVSLIVVAIMAQTWWSIIQDRQLTLVAAQENGYLTVRILEEHASRILHDASRAINAAAEEIQSGMDPAPHDEAEVRKVLINERQDSPFLQSLSIIDANGILWGTSFQYPAEPQDMRSVAYVKDLLEHPANKEFVTGKPMQLPNSNRWVLPVAKNIFNQHGEHVGILQAYIGLGYLREFYERLAKDGGAIISLHNQQGNLYLRAPNDPLYLNQDISKSLLANTLRSSAIEGSLQDGPLVGGDAQLIYTYRKTADFPIALVYARAIDTILADWRERARQKLIFALLTISCILVFIILLIGKIRRLRGSAEDLRASENRYRMLFQDAEDTILLINREYKYVDCNAAALEMFGITDRAELLGKRAGRFSPEKQPVRHLPGLQRDRLIETLVDTAFTGEVQHFDWIITRKGVLLYSEVTMSRVEIGDESLIFCVMRDVSARKAVELLLEGQNQLLQLIATSEDMLIILESICQFAEKLSPNWRCGIQLLGNEQHSLSMSVGKNFPDVLKPQLDGMPVTYGNGVWCEAILNASPVWIDGLQTAASMQFVNALETLMEFPACGAWPIMGKKGQLLGSFTLFSHSAEELNDHQLKLIGITTDIASIAIEGRRSEDKILKLAHYDELTGLPNRFLYSQHLSKSLAHAERDRSRLAVFFLDLDRFKNINDTFGHDEGDTVLRNIAQRFKQCLRESDIIARVGGDEFILLVDQFNDPKDLGDIADKLLFEASYPFDLRGQECQLSASIGIATFPDDGRDPQTLLKNADIAMYRAKNKGKDNYQFYASEMNVHTVERLAFEARLRRALERREFVVYYQPKVNVASGKIVGAEALVRWNHPERGILFPGDFILLAEEAGLIARLGMLVLDIACRDVLAFRAVDKSFGRVSINLSGAQFNDVHLLEEVKSVVDFWRVDPGWIEFEITESMVMHNRDQAIILMDGLKEAGFTLSIDDFGTGYSSLAYLKRFPVDSVKVDRSFIKDIPSDPNDTAIVLAIVAMAHTLSLKVIAEGVETELQLDTLKANHCDEYQGFYFSKAIPESEFLLLLQRQYAEEV
ncbi:EAL domain-containing protein [Undibacterium sp. Jales W-56]|uniref:EAL domain-containing protein n=1 Tax=Undibacterium sp. Jales W-56 TaxID=2897325 RepID=UPI0021CE9F1F|nr:EAL domain-containing protein [Undibacterium sp. Jales W-56]MCU6432302.1 EAL domain-containing protein [Undibacterium sp. Jales W-56]